MTEPSHVGASDNHDTETDAATTDCDGEKGCNEVHLTIDGDNAGGPDETAGQPAARRRANITRRSPTRQQLAALALAAVLGAAGYEGWLLYQQQEVDTAAEHALAAARIVTLALTTVDPTTIDQNFANVENGTTGDFKQKYTAAGAQLRRALIANKAAAQGTVIDAAVKSATKDTVEVILFVDQSVHNSASPEPQLDRSRVTMTMQDVDGHWLAGKVELS